jgi:hypothetical protein
MVLKDTVRLVVVVEVFGTFAVCRGCKRWKRFLRKREVRDPEGFVVA